MDNKFHEHLDKCSRCANQPMNLCSVGAKLLQQVATEPFKNMFGGKKG